MRLDRIGLWTCAVLAAIVLDASAAGGRHQAYNPPDGAASQPRASGTQAAGTRPAASQPTTTQAGATQPAAKATSPPAAKPDTPVV